MPSFFDSRPFREASQLNGFSGNIIERWSEARDAASLGQALADPAARIYLFAAERPLLTRRDTKPDVGFALSTADQLGLKRESLVLLGVTPSGPRFGGLVSGEAPTDTAELGDLRALAVEGALPADDLAALAQARSYLHWHAANRFCGRCGGVLTPIRGGVGRACAACNAETFPRVDPVVIMLALDGERCLLGRQPQFAPGMYSALAGFLEPGETIEEAVRRETREESGLTVGRVHYHSSQAWPFPSSLMLGCHAEALSTDVHRDAAELEDCRWFPRDEVGLMLAGAHPQGLKTPPKMAIAHALIAAFAAWDGTRLQ